MLNNNSKKFENYSNLKFTNPQQHRNYKKRYLVSKTDLAKEEDKRKEIEDAFSDPSKYFQNDQNEMIIGNLKFINY